MAAVWREGGSFAAKSTCLWGVRGGRQSHPELSCKEGDLLTELQNSGQAQLRISSFSTAPPKRCRRLKPKPAFYVLLLALLLGVAVFAYVMLEKQVELIDGEESRILPTRANTVGDFLEQYKVELAELDVVEPALDAKLADESQVIIHRAFNVAVSADFKTESYPTQPQTVSDFLAANNVELGEYDWVSPSPDHILAEGENVVINRIT